MFSVNDYKALLSEGVDASMVALAECAYKVLFEAGVLAKTGIELMPYPYGTVAGFMNIDVSDCLSDDGKTLNNAKVARKLNESPCFRAIEQKVSDIVDVGLNTSGIGYRKPDGTFEYVYPNVQRNSDLRNTIENIKMVMTCRIAGIVWGKFARDVTTPLGESAVAFVNQINAEVAGRRLGKVVMGRFHDLIVQDALPTGKVFPDAYGFNDAVVSPIADVDVSEGAHLIVKNSDGSEWWSIPGIETNSGYTDNADTHIAWLLMNDFAASKDSRIRDAAQTDGYAVVVTQGNFKYLTRLHIGSPNRRFEISNFVEAFNLMLTLGETGFFNSISDDFVFTGEGENGFTIRWNTFISWIQTQLKRLMNVSLKFLLYCRFAKLIAGSVSPEDAFRAGTRTHIYAEGAGLFGDGDIDEPYSVLDSLAGLVGCLSANLIDIEDVKELVQEGVDSDSLRNIFDATTESKIRNLGHISIDDLTMALKLYPDESLYGLSGGTEDSASSRRHKVNNLPLETKHGLSTETPRRMNNPEYQARLIETSSIGHFMDVLNHLFYESHEYVSISDDAIEAIFEQGAPKTSPSILSSIIEYLYYWVSKITDIKRKNSYSWMREIDIGSVDARLAMRIQDDCRRILTPAFQELAYNQTCSEESGSPTEETDDLLHKMKYLMVHVRGMRVAPIVLHSCYKMACYNNDDPDDLFNKSVDAKGLVRVIRFHQENNGEDSITLFRKYATTPEVLYDVERNTVWGRRLKEVFAKLYESSGPRDKALLLMPANSDSYDYDSLGDDNARTLVSYVKAYIEPNKNLISNYGSDDFAIFSKLLELYSLLFEADEALAAKVFLDRKGGLFKCYTNSLQDVPVGNGGKMVKKMVARDRNDVRSKLLFIYYRDTTPSRGGIEMPAKASAGLIGTCFAGRHMLMYNDIATLYDGEMIDAIFTVSKQYDTDVEPGHRVIEPEDLANFMEYHADQMLSRIDRIPVDVAKELCQKYLTPEKLQKMSSTSEGLLMLIRLSVRAGWELFSRQFIRANEMNINKLIDTLPPDEAAVLAKKVKALAGNTSQFAVSGGVATASKGQGSIQYHVANGLNWMDGFVKLNKGKTNTSRNATLFSMDEARQYIANGLPAGWRLPTLSEIEHLGNDPEVVAKKHLGFEPTGRMDENYELIDTFGCYAWCTNGDDLTAYSVVNNAVEPDDFMVDTATESLAIKLVQ